MYRKLLLALCLALPAFGQTYTFVNPDCIIPFSFTAIGATITVSGGIGDIRQQGCDVWSMTYSVSGFSAVNISLQSAPNAAGFPGSWTTFSGQTLINGTSNPNTSTTTSTFTQLTGYQPWARVSLNTATGSGIVTGVAFGWRIPSASGSGSGGGGTSNVAIVSPLGPQTAATSVAAVSQGQAATGSALSGNPTLVGGSDGTDVRNIATDINGDTSSLCTNPATYSQALFNLSGSGNTQIAAGTSGKQIRVCQISFSTGTAENWKLTQGTGTNCGTSTTDLTGLYISDLAAVLDTNGTLAAIAGDNVCFNQANAQTLGGTILYVVF